MTDPGRNRRRDIWQLHVPLAIALVICTTATIIELSRATDGVWRAWVYSIEWPAIGAFCIWMWIRFRREGNPVAGTVRRWQERVASIEAEASQSEVSPSEHGAGVASREPVTDPQLASWRAYQRQVRERDQP